MTRGRILITGAAGNLGVKAREGLMAAGCTDLVLLDRVADTCEDVRGADLSCYDPEWVELLDGVDVIVHLAADADPVAGWESVVANNVDASLRVLRAAADAGVGRVVFASSNWVLGGHRFTGEPLTAATPPRPVNPYGSGKLFVERAGLELAAHGGPTFIALRIGCCQRGENVPGPHMGFGRWGQEMWLSNDDWMQAVVLACTATTDASGVCNLMSQNRGMRWDLTETERLLGYRPTRTHLSCRS